MGKSNTSRKQIKFISQALTFITKPSVLINSAGFVIIMWITSNLIYRLSGYYEYVLRMYNSIKVSGAVYTGPWPEVSAAAAAVCVLLALLQIILDVGYAGYTLQVSRGKKAGFNAVFCGFDHPLKALALGLYKYACIYIGLGFFVVPGVYFAYRYRFLFFSLFDMEDEPLPAVIRASAGEMRGNKTKMLIFDASFLGWLVVGYMLGQGFLPLLDIWVRPYMGIAGAVCYNLITEKGGVITIKVDEDGAEIISEEKPPEDQSGDGRNGGDKSK